MDPNFIWWSSLTQPSVVTKWILVTGALIFAVFDVHPVVAQECSRATSTLFASKTAYRNSLRTSSSSGPLTYPGCEPVQVYLVARHGTRFPGASDVHDMIHKVPRLQELIVNASESKLGEMCLEDIEVIKNWQLQFNGSSTNLLAEEGRRELFGIAKRLQAKFPSLFVQPYSSSRYIFRATKTPRTEDSAKSFAQGLFDTDKGVDIHLDEDEELLRFYKKCKKWEQEVDDRDEALDEFYHFTFLADVVAMTEDVSRRLGLASILSFDDVWILYEMCRFDTAWNRRSTSSPWCNVFSDTDFEVLAYAEDLRYYWKEGYGYTINYQQACPVVKNIVDNFNRSVLEGVTPAAEQTQPPPPIGLFHFSHSGMLLKLYARLGLYQDESPLLATNYREGMKQRRWKTSLMDPFAANLVFVLFKCANEEYKVGTYVQEQEVILGNCTTALCPLTTFMETYGPIADSCDLDAICDVRNGSTSMLVFGTLGVVFSLTVIIWFR